VSLEGLIYARFLATGSGGSSHSRGNYRFLFYVDFLQKSIKKW
jgi:hypothetical protein